MGPRHPWRPQTIFPGWEQSRVLSLPGDFLAQTASLSLEEPINEPDRQDGLKTRRVAVCHEGFARIPDLGGVRFDSACGSEACWARGFWSQTLVPRRSERHYSCHRPLPSSARREVSLLPIRHQAQMLVTLEYSTAEDKCGLSAESSECSPSPNAFSQSWRWPGVDLSLRPVPRPRTSEPPAGSRLHVSQRIRQSSKSKAWKRQAG